MPENTEVTAGAGENNRSGEDARFTQEDVNRIVQERLDRERKRFEGFDEYKQAAERLASVEAERNELAAEIGELRAEKQHRELVEEIAETTGVPARALKGANRAELEAHAEILKPLLQATGPVVPGQEMYPEKVTSDPLREFTRNLFAQAKKE